MAYAYKVREDAGQVRLGLVVLQTDETIERDFRRLVPEGVELYVSRIANAQEVTRETLGAMAGAITASAGLFPDVAFAGVGYGCTSASSVIGTERVGELVKAGCQTQMVSEPVSAAVAACGALGISKLAFLSPYVEEVSETLRGAFADQGIETPVFGSFDEGRDPMVVRIDADSVFDAACDLASSGGVEGIFLSCTNLRTLDVIERIEAATGLTVLSSNQCLAWHLMSAAGVQPNGSGYGCLFQA